MCGQCRQHIKLVALVNDVSLRKLIPDELGAAWDGVLRSVTARLLCSVCKVVSLEGNPWPVCRLFPPASGSSRERFLSQTGYAPNPGK